MSRQLLNEYYNRLAETIRYGGNRNETSIRHAFFQLVNDYAERRNLLLVPEIAIKGAGGATIRPDGTLKLDTETVLQGVPASAWEYRLGNRSALEWILDQYKERRPSDATIAEKFNAYRFADYKETVVDLLKRVCTVSVRTVELTNQMPADA
jgi:hypothetical protein